MGCSIGSRIRTLLRRLRYLEGQIADPTSSPQALSYVKAEHSALKWALRELAKLHPEISERLEKGHTDGQRIEG